MKWEWICLEDMDACLKERGNATRKGILGMGKLARRVGEVCVATDSRV